MVPARKTVTKKTLHEGHSSKNFGLRQRLAISYELGLQDEKKFQWKLGNIGHSEDDKFHTLLKLKI